MTAGTGQAPQKQLHTTVVLRLACKKRSAKVQFKLQVQVGSPFCAIVPVTAGTGQSPQQQLRITAVLRRACKTSQSANAQFQLQVQSEVQVQVQVQAG